jgi:hypothetical protein
MNFLSRLVGKDAENLTSAILKHILERSPELRQGAIDALSDSCPAAIATLSAERSFGVTLEESTTQTAAEADRGRVDLVLEFDEALLGVENKLNAVLQQNQPSKYLETLGQRAAQLMAARGRNSFPYACVILAPEHRRAVISKELQTQVGYDAERLGFCSWQQMLSKMTSREPSDPVARFLLRELDDFVQDQTGSIRVLAGRLQRLRQDMMHVEDLYVHEDLVRRLWDFFRPTDLESAPTRLGVPKNKAWAGYNLLNSSAPNSERLGNLGAWYGFISASLLVEPRENWGSELVLYCSQDIPNLDPACFEKVNVKGGFPPNPKVWRIRLDESWADSEKWRKALEPFQAFVRSWLTPSDVVVGA